MRLFCNYFRNSEGKSEKNKNGVTASPTRSTSGGRVSSSASSKMQECLRFARSGTLCTRFSAHSHYMVLRTSLLINSVDAYAWVPSTSSIAGCMHVDCIGMPFCTWRRFAARDVRFGLSAVAAAAFCTCWSVGGCCVVLTFVLMLRSF